MNLLDLSFTVILVNNTIKYYSYLHESSNIKIIKIFNLKQERHANKPLM